MVRRLSLCSPQRSATTRSSGRVDARRGLATGSPFQVTCYNKDPAETIADNIESTEFSVGGTRLALAVQRLVGGIWVLR